MKNDRIKRVKQMENIMDKSADIFMELNMVLDKLEENLSDYKKLDEYKNLLKTINTAKIKKENLPDSEVVRFYGQIDENKFFVIGKLVYDMKTKTYRVVGSTQGKELFDRISLFDRLDSVTYSDEIYF